MSEFKLEDRYIVLKIKHLSEEQLAKICDAIKDAGAMEAVRSWKCVVIEAHWPIYNDAVDMIQKFADGHPQEIDKLKTANAKAESYCSLMNDAIQDFCTQFELHDGQITQTDIDMLREYTFNTDNMKEKLTEVQAEALINVSEKIRNLRALNASTFADFVLKEAELLSETEALRAYEYEKTKSDLAHAEKIKLLDDIEREDAESSSMYPFGIRAPQSHELKTDPDVFDASWTGKRNYEIRYNDRDYQVGDTLRLRETKFCGVEIQNGMPLSYTGREMNRVVTHILEGYGLDDGWVILSVEPVANYE